MGDNGRSTFDNEAIDTGLQGARN